MKYFIYTETDPRDNLIRYVGKTNNLARRQREHMRDTRQDQATLEKIAWLEDLKQSGLEALVQIVDEIETDIRVEATRLETKYIEKFIAEGHPLTNWEGVAHRKSLAWKQARLSRLRPNG
jgi:hypothetical protein